MYIFMSCASNSITCEKGVGPHRNPSATPCSSFYVVALTPPPFIKGEERQQAASFPSAGLPLPTTFTAFRLPGFRRIHRRPIAMYSLLLLLLLLFITQIATADAFAHGRYPRFNRADNPNVSALTSTYTSAQNLTVARSSIGSMDDEQRPPYSPRIYLPIHPRSHPKWPGGYKLWRQIFRV